MQKEDDRKAKKGKEKIKKKGGSDPLLVRIKTSDAKK
jgi:hypothetical protein